jgi:dihydrofolate reductase
MTTSLIVAAADNDVIGRAGALPWHLPADMRRFRALTTGHVVVMGRLTHESIVARLGHPLANRTSIVVSRTLQDAGDDRVLVVGSMDSALATAASIGALAGSGEYFVIGGESVYRQALPSVDRIYLTRVHLEVSGDRRMPGGWLAGFELVSQEDTADPDSGTGYSYLGYRRAAA